MQPPPRQSPPSEREEAIRRLVRSGWFVSIAASIGLFVGLFSGNAIIIALDVLLGTIGVAWIAISSRQLARERERPPDDRG